VRIDRDGGADGGVGEDSSSLLRFGTFSRYLMDQTFSLIAFGISRDMD